MVILLNELPAATHGGNFPPAFNIIMVKNDVNVHEREQDEKPHEGVVPLPHGKIAPHQRHDPGKEFGEPGLAHGRIKPEAGDALEKKRQEGHEISESRHGIVPDRFNGLVIRLQQVHGNHLADLLPLFLAVGNKIPPVGIAVPGEPPINPKEEIKKEEVAE